MTALQLQRMGNAPLLIAALRSGEVRLYNHKSLISSIQTTEVVSALRFGPYGREDACLASCCHNGALSIRFLARQASLEKAASAGGPPPEQGERPAPRSRPHCAL
jgi:L-asparaginase II